MGSPSSAFIIMALFHQNEDCKGYGGNKVKKTLIFRSRWHNK